MTPAITFVIPVRHQDNAADWAALRGRLRQTSLSIAAQTSDNWRAVVVANEGADLPDLPDGFAVERVTFPPNARYDIAAFDSELVYDSFRLDKGRRVLMGMLAARDTRYFMIVDDDDFVSARLASFANENAGANGWKIVRGWVWGEDGRLLMRHDDFSNFCGTSLIVRSDLYDVPETFEAATEDYIKTMLGSHVRISRILAERGTPLAPLPFRGAVYRVGHSGAHSKSRGLLMTFVFNSALLRRPWQAVGNLLRFRMTDSSLKREFFATGPNVTPTRSDSGAVSD